LPIFSGALPTVWVWGDWIVAYCGLNCAKCDIYEAGHGNEEKEAKPKKPAPQRKPRADKPQHPESKPEGNYVLIPEGMIRIEYQNKVLMFLPKGDKEMRQLAAKLARQFIETYQAEIPEDSSSNSSP